MQNILTEKAQHVEAINQLNHSPNSSSIMNTLNNQSDFNSGNDSGNILVVDSGHHADSHLIDEHRHNHDAFVAKHAGHENQHLAMILILVVVMVLSQILLVWWKNKFQKSYIHTSMIAMYLIPFGISAYRHWWRFVSIWVIISLITIALVWRPLLMPNFSRSGSAIPRLLYRWFFTLYSVSSVIAVSGYTILLLTFFGINILLNISPQVALDIGFMMLFYGIYYGVLCRDFTDFLVDKLAAQIGYYNPTSALPSKLLRSNICAICGREHGDKENIDMDDISKNEPLLPDHSSYLGTDEHPDQETLIDYSDNTNQKERLFILTCGHKFHEYCIYGWSLVGKRQVCPFCREKVDLGRMFSALPFQKPHYLYGNLLDLIRYLFAWQPVIFLTVHFLDYELGLE